MPLPVAITQPATNITPSTARINGKISDDGGASCEARFRWRISGGQKYEYYDTGDIGSYGFYTYYWKAQTFTPSVNHKITSVKLKLLRNGSPGTVTVSIRATDVNGKPAGSDLCSGTTDGNTLPTGSPYEWREITLGAGYRLSVSTTYAIVVRALNGDSSNYLLWRADNTSPTYAGGSYGASGTSGNTWSMLSSIDFMFEEWSDWVTTNWQNTLVTDSTYYEDLTDLIGATEYEFQTQAKNSAGEGDWSASAYFWIAWQLLKCDTNILLKGDGNNLLVL